MKMNLRLSIIYWKKKTKQIFEREIKDEEEESGLEIDDHADKDLEDEQDISYSEHEYESIDENESENMNGSEYEEEASIGDISEKMKMIMNKPNCQLGEVPGKMQEQVWQDRIHTFNSS